MKREEEKKRMKRGLKIPSSSEQHDREPHHNIP